MGLSSVAHFTRWSDWIRRNSLCFHSHSPLGESKVPERFHAWDRGVAVARFPPPQTTLANTLPPARLSAAAPFQRPPLTAWKREAASKAEKAKLRLSWPDWTLDSRTIVALFKSFTIGIRKKKKMKKTQLQNWYSGQKGQVEFSQFASELAIIPWPQSSAWGFSLTGLVRLLKEDLRVSGEQSSCRLSSTCQSVDGPQHNHCRWSTTTLCKGQARQNPLFPQTQTKKKKRFRKGVIYLNRERSFKKAQGTRLV